VVTGFKRGSKELGIPTANLDMEELGTSGDNFDPGIYFGWARLRGECFQAVVSVGWNPFYNNTLKTIEAHLLVPLDDFYGERLELYLLGYLRPEANFKSLGMLYALFLSCHWSSSLDELIDCIQLDIQKSKTHLEKFVDISQSRSTWSC
jgi:FAD synthase